MLKIWSIVCSKGRQIKNKGSLTISSKFCVEIGHFGKISYFSRSDTICAPTRHTKRLLVPKIPKKRVFFQARACCVQALEKHPKRPKWTPWVLSFPTHQLRPPSDLSIQKYSDFALFEKGDSPRNKTELIL